MFGLLEWILILYLKGLKSLTRRKTKKCYKAREKRTTRLAIVILCYISAYEFCIKAAYIGIDGYEKQQPVTESEDNGRQLEY